MRIKRETPHKSQKRKTKRTNARRSNRKGETTRNNKQDQALMAASVEFHDVAFLASKPRSDKTPEVIAAYAPLIGWLNGEQRDHRNPAFRNTDESILRIEELLKLIQKLADHEAAEAKKPRQFPQTVTFRHDLSRYATMPYLQYDCDRGNWGIGRWPLGLPGTPGSDTAEEDLQKWFPTRAKWSERPWTPFGEVMAANGIFYLLARGLLGRVSKCHCGDWYFKPRANSRACTKPKCRKRLFDQTPEQKQYRKGKNRHNYLVRTGQIHLCRCEDCLRI
jgi:hypothetical protein